MIQLDLNIAIHTAVLLQIQAFSQLLDVIRKTTKDILLIAPMKFQT